MQSQFLIELVEIVFDHANFITKIRIRQITKKLYKKLFISDFLNIPAKYVEKLTDDALLNHRFITKLHANKNIRSIKYLTRLTELTTKSYYINDEDIAKLDLKMLHATNNSAITNLNHLTNLEILYADASSDYSWCTFPDAAISNLTNLKFLCMDYNYQITNINYFTNLEVLYAKGYWNPSLNMSRLNLKELRINTKFSPIVFNLNHMDRLQILHADNCHCITDNHISMLNLKELRISDKTQITTVNFMTSLEVLYMNEDHGLVTDISGLNLRELYVNNNTKITKIDHMNNLKVLGAGGLSAITDREIAKLDLTELYVRGNKRITNVNHLTNLQILQSKRSGIGKN